MDKSLKILSLLLGYPTTELQQDIPEIKTILNSENKINAAIHQQLNQLLAEISEYDIYDLEEQYVMLFDRSRSLSLNLFEHVHGESRDRGSAMVSLLDSYRAENLELNTPELPDHLPVLLEFLSTLPTKEAQSTLADAAHIFEALAVRLARRKSSYQAVFAALLQLAGADADNKALKELLQQPDEDPQNLEALDELWEEKEVKFGADPNAGCPQMRDMLARIDPVAKPETPAE